MLLNGLYKNQFKMSRKISVAYGTLQSVSLPEVKVHTKIAESKIM